MMIIENSRNLKLLFMEFYGIEVLFRAFELATKGEVY